MQHLPRINSPCLVPWDGMDALPNGNRYCHQCRKPVHDLTARTPQAIADMVQAAGGKLCGRMKQTITLPKPTMEKQPRVDPQRVGRNWRLAASAGLMALGLGMLQAQAPLVPQDSLAWRDSVRTEIAPTVGGAEAPENAPDTVLEVGNTAPVQAAAATDNSKEDSEVLEHFVTGDISMPIRIPSPENIAALSANANEYGFYSRGSFGEIIYEDDSVYYYYAPPKISPLLIMLGNQIDPHFVQYPQVKENGMRVWSGPTLPSPPQEPTPVMAVSNVMPKRRAYHATMRRRVGNGRGPMPRRTPTQLPWDQSSLA